ncbi:GGDEF domain-containing phosphodiesterase [Sphingomonas sp. 1P06PA]|uniref:bifunctional diguanylate cyclase/phosphodiesterase n=1 Tax=Sphingomonas sp. 1P06PA TaxID=554121 RepID=UPI0039A7390C
MPFAPANPGPPGRDSLRMCVAALLAGAASVLAMAGSGTLSAIPAAAACGLALSAAWRVGRAERHLAGLIEDGAASGGLHRLITALDARLEAVRHRTMPIHPVTRLVTREPLFAAIESVARDPAAPRLLGVIRLIDHDRIAAFDQAAANRVLIGFAKRLAGAVPRGVLLAQVDRDAFALWFGDCDGDCDSQAAQLRSILFVAAQELDDVGTILTPTIAAGSACWPEDGAAPAMLLAQAVAALIECSSDAAGGLAPGRAEERAAARERFVLEQDLAQAIAEDQLTMFFQPVVDLARGRIVGAEALLRWEHPTLGNVSPARFIPVVEAIGLGERYGLWVLNTAAREARRWRDAGHADFKMAVNLSARQLLDDQLATKIARTLDRHGLPANAIELELTETAAMADASRTLNLFGTLRAMGISLAIDDFGSGYSSLSYLKNLPFDKLKIDREFVSGIDTRPDSRAICAALIALGNGLGLRVLAEGVETETEVAALRALGCGLFQGYHFARPLAGDDFLALAEDPAFLARLAPPVHRQIDAIESRLSA